MEELKFKAKLWKTGSSSVVTIPSDYVSNELIEKNKEYLFVIKEVGDNAEEHQKDRAMEE